MRHLAVESDSISKYSVNTEFSNILLASENCLLVWKPPNTHVGIGFRNPFIHSFIFITNLANVYQVPACAKNCSGSNRTTIIIVSYAFLGFFPVYRIGHLIFTIAGKWALIEVCPYTVLQMREESL